MLNRLFLYMAFILAVQSARGQDSLKKEYAAKEYATKVYTIKKSVDIPLIAGAAVWDLYGFSQVSKKGDVSVKTVNALQKSDVPWFDRWGMYPYSKSIDKLSYVPFYVAIPLPLIVIAADGKLRKDFATLGFLYAEAMCFTGVLYSSAVHYVNRYRPLVYSQESPIGTRTVSNSRNSFFAGHVALVGTSAFFAAQVLADYHPDSKYKWVYYAAAAGLTGITGYWRNRAGEHFPSDIAVGTVAGVCSGLLTPRLHKAKIIKNQRLSIFPYSGRTQGIAALYKL